MSDAKSQHEPSMEEILASIRRIIAEDGETPDPAAAPAAAPAPAPKEAKLAPRPAGAEDDVLELTEVVEEPPAAAPDPARAPEPEPPFSLEAAPAPSAEAGDGEAEDRLVSSTSAAASVAALSQLVSHRQRDRGGELPLGAVDRTLEDMVRELIKPLLRTWLDENLPQLVERLVRDEIARLVREAQGR